MPEDTDLYAAAKAEGAKFGISQDQGEAIEEAFGLSPVDDGMKIKPVLHINKRAKDFRGRNVARAMSKSDEPMLEATFSGLVIDRAKYLGCLAKAVELIVTLPDGSGGSQEVNRWFFVDEIDPGEKGEEFMAGTITATSDPDITGVPVT
jgi:hypothetical protein